MECPKDMAESILRKWQESSAVLVVRLAGYGFSASMGGTIAAFDISEGIEISALAVSSATGDVTIAPGSMRVGLRGASFEFLDAREAPEDLREASTVMFESILKAIVPAVKDNEEPDYMLVLSEMREHT